MAEQAEETKENGPTAAIDGPNGISEQNKGAEVRDRSSGSDEAPTKQAPEQSESKQDGQKKPSKLKEAWAKLGLDA